MGNSGENNGGRSIADLLLNGRLPANLATYVLAECAKVLKEAASSGQFHDNVKPANILVGSSGKIKLVKFQKRGGGSNTSHLLKSNLFYLAPERISSDEGSSITSDLFSLGATYYEMLMGEKAFNAGSGQEIKERVLKADPTPNLLDDDAIHTQVRRICQQMLRKKPQQRYQNYGVLLADLDAYKKSQGIEVLGSSGEMRRYLSNPDGYVSPAKKRGTDWPGSSNRRPQSPKANTSRIRASNKGDGEKSTFSRIFLVVGLIVAVFASLSFAGNFFFDKSGKWGGTNSSNTARSSSEESSSTVTVQKGGRSGNKTVQASGSSSDQSSTNTATISGQSESVEVIDLSEQENSDLNQDNQDLYATSLEGVDTVIVLPDDDVSITGRLVIKSMPRSVVYFEGDSIGVTPLPIVTRPGTYNVILKSPSFPNFETLVDVLPNRETPIEVSLWFLVGRLYLDVPTGAAVYLDDTLLQQTSPDSPIPVLPGERRIRIVGANGEEKEEVFDFSAGDEKTASFVNS